MKPADRRRRQLTWGFLLAEGYVALIAVAFLLIGLAYLAPGPESGHTYPVTYPLDLYINSFYVAGSMTVLVGFFTRRVGVEVAGHVALVPAFFMGFGFAVAHLLTVGFGPDLRLERTVLIMLILALASAARAWGLVLRERGILG